VNTLKESGWIIPDPEADGLMTNIGACQVSSEPLVPSDLVYIAQGPTGTKYLACERCFVEIQGHLPMQA